MAEVFAVYIGKLIPWHSGLAPFGNTYHLKAGLTQPFEDEGVIDALVAAEKAIHATNIQFVKARTWGPTDEGQTASKMRVVKDLSGTGAAVPASSFFNELANMVYWPLGRYGSRNRPQFLRKWLHCGKNVANVPMDGSRSTSPATTDLTTYINAVTSVRGGLLTGTYPLCTFDGREPISPGLAYPYMEHHQLGR